MTGRMYDERLGRIGALLVFVGFNVTFIPQFLAGIAGMPRRYATYAARFQGLNRMSTVGAFVLAAGLVFALWSLLVSLRRDGPRAPPNPWGAASLEWAAPSPPPHDNFEAPPPVGKPYDFTGLRHASEDAGWVREEAP